MTGRSSALTIGACSVLMAALSAAGGSAWADELPPVFDVTGMCQMELKAEMPDHRVQECVWAEQRALTYLRVVYSAVPLRVRRRCERLSRADTRGFGSYAFIQGCVDLK